MQNIISEMQKHDALLNKQVFFADDHIVINVEYEYNIALSRCNTESKILSWVHHLTEKTWMTNEVMERFIEMACEAHNLTLEQV